MGEAMSLPFLFRHEQMFDSSVWGSIVCPAIGSGLIL